MVKLAYILGIKGYKMALQLAKPFHKKASLFLEGRKNWRNKLKSQIGNQTATTAWFHCASLGEFEQGRPVIEAFKREYPDIKVVLTFFSPSGYEVRKNYSVADVVTYLPLDTPENARDFIAIVQPTVAFFVKYEFWHYYLKELRSKEVLTLSISAIFREDQLFFKSYGQFYRDILENFNHIFVQDEDSAKLLSDIAYRNYKVAGDTRFDRVKEIVDGRKELPDVASFKQGIFTLVVGSSWMPDIEVISSMLNNFDLPLKLIIAPHEIGEENLVKTEQAFQGKKVVRYSKLNESTASEYDILLIDNIGLLTSLYSYGDLAYVGGAFGKGLHNILEAASYGIPVIFGDNYGKFKEARDLVELKGVFSIKNDKELSDIFHKLYTNSLFREKVGKICSDYVVDNTGATVQIMEYCKNQLTLK